jgi:hypothetical protein
VRPNVRHERQTTARAMLAKQPIAARRCLSARWRGYASPDPKRRKAAKRRSDLTPVAVTVHGAGRSVCATSRARSRQPNPAPPCLNAGASVYAQARANGAALHYCRGAACRPTTARTAQTRAAVFVWPALASRHRVGQTALRCAQDAARTAQAPTAPHSCAAPATLRFARTSRQTARR